MKKKEKEKFTMDHEGKSSVDETGGGFVLGPVN